MRFVAAAVLGLAFIACATPSSSSENGTMSAQAGSCSPATVNGEAIVYTSPDSTSAPVAKLANRSRVCADSEQTGFGYRHVKLDNGKEGYVSDSDLI
ncbi:MAG: SH3 domain-containing protein [Myxococcales bacterium]|nr:SH3 domain-containing protein [Myxococcales bacterium]